MISKGVKGVVDINSKIACCLKNKYSFALYRKPCGGKNFYFCHNTASKDEGCVCSENGIFNSIKRKFSAEKGDFAGETFLFAPFSSSSSARHPVVLINFDKKYSFTVPDFGSSSRKSFSNVAISESFSDELPPCDNVAPLPKHTIKLSRNKENYYANFDLFCGAVEQGKFKKLVLSDYAQWTSSTQLSLLNSFLAACRVYPKAFVYVFYSHSSGLWLGASPELLLSVSTDGMAHTVALAGTQLRKPGTGTVSPDDEGISGQYSTISGSKVSWDAKNLEEQRVVADYVSECLREVALDFQKGELHTISTGKLLHLKTDFYFQLKNTEKDFLSTISLLSKLHPTPAVCGFPKGEAMDFILSNEGYDRAYYCGMVGLLDYESSDIFVNLRCSKLDTLHSGILYAGGGIMPQSIADTEWLEIENKLRSMVDIFRT